MLHDIENKINKELNILKNNIATCKARLEAWEHVKPCTKKNGDAFSVFSKNFNGCKIRPHDSWSNKGNICMYINYYTDVYGYENDYISVADRVENGIQLADIPDNRIKYDEYGNAWVIKSLDEVWKLIEEAKERDRNYIKEAKKSLEKAPKLFEKITAIAKQFDELRSGIEEENYMLKLRADSLMKALL